MGFFTKLSWALKAFKMPSLQTSIVLDNGLIVDIKNNRLIFPNNLHIHTMENLKLSADKNVIISSGQSEDLDRPGYIYGVWINSKEDNLGRPLLENESEIIEANQHGYIKSD